MGRRTSAAVMTAFFLLANMLGFLAALELRTVPAVQEAAANYQTAESGLLFFAAIGLSTIVLLLLYRFNAGLVVKVWFATALAITTFIFLDALVPSVPALIGTVAVLGMRWRTRDPLLRNLLDTMPFAGAGAFFGSLIGAVPAGLLYAVLAVYDVVAVRFSGHMVTLAKEGAASGTFMGFTYPKDGSPADLADAELEPVDTEAGGGVGVLGGGDVIVPMLFGIALIGAFGPAAALSSMLGAGAALYLFMARLSGTDFYPAIPVVAAGSLAGLLAWYGLSLLV